MLAGQDNAAGAARVGDLDRLGVAWLQEPVERRQVHLVSLPLLGEALPLHSGAARMLAAYTFPLRAATVVRPPPHGGNPVGRAAERRVGKECARTSRSRGSAVR